MINFTAQNIVPTILAFNYHKSDEIWRFHIQGCEFNICDGVLGYIHPVVGWFQVYDFNGSDPRGGTAEENIQWVLDEYGNEYTYQVLDFDAYYLEEIGSGFSALRKSGDHFIGTCCFREETLELEKEGTIKILSVDPRG